VKREGTIGTVSFLAIAALIGFSVQTGTKPPQNNGLGNTAAAKGSKPSPTKGARIEYKPGCDSLGEQLEDFLEIENMGLPDNCYQPNDPRRRLPHPDPTKITEGLKFVVALLPDPVHTHLPVVFDQFAVAIQEGAQDEKYDFDGSWMPWSEEETPYALYIDEKAANTEREFKETQPGIILFRKTMDCGNKKLKKEKGHEEEEAREELEEHEKQEKCREDWEKGGLSKSYREGLIVFVVGEEATHGIHRDQFRNALAWIQALRLQTDPKGKPLAILGPTYSGSLSSLAEMLSETKIKAQLNLASTPGKTPDNADPCKDRDDNRLAIYSGSASSNESAEAFQCSIGPHAAFHSFVQNDDEILRRFCRYINLEQEGFDASRVAMISEDETAYGLSGIRAPKTENLKANGTVRAGKANDEASEADDPDDNGCPDRFLTLYYPRDISALRGAYQSTSLFDAGSAPQPTDAQKKNLPTDLADPAGKVHDSIRSYGGNQTPLNQEAFLMDIVAALREQHARYILLRSSNTLDQLFLSNFLRRSYPDGRIVIFGSDLMFVRERGTTGLNGSMTLSTYPLFPLEHRWTDHQRLAAADRVFSADTSEGTYVAFRLLLNDQSLNQGAPEVAGCHVQKEDEGRIFLPAVECATDTSPIPDYSPPFWTLSDQCGERNVTNKGPGCPYHGPAIWLSVIGVNRFWPMASLTKKTHSQVRAALGLWEGPEKTKDDSERAHDPGGRPEMPLGMRVFLLVLAGFSLFHAWCCWFGSYTAKPAFRAHFANEGDWRHSLLVFAGSACVAFMGIVTGWGCGVFTRPDAGLAYPWTARYCMTFVCAAAFIALIGNNYTAWRLSKMAAEGANVPGTKSLSVLFLIRSGVALILLFAVLQIFYQQSIAPTEQALLSQNRVLTYWRAMHLTSGVSPLVPMLSILGGLYLTFWYALHGLALFGPDRPYLPAKADLELKIKGEIKNYFRMFSQEDGAKRIEEAATPLNWKIMAGGAAFFALFLYVPWKIALGVPIRSLGAETYSIIFFVGLDVCCSVAMLETWRLYETWEELRRLLAFLDRLALRRTLAALHGFSWGSVWKMSGNVLEVRYKVISRQLECMNHTITSLQNFLKKSSDPTKVTGTLHSLYALESVRDAGMVFANWYSENYTILRAGDMTSFENFQKSIAAASGTLLTELLVPEWRSEKGSLLATPIKKDKEESTPDPPPQAKQAHTRNAEEFVCLNYMAFVQNILGRLRTIVMTIVLLFLAAILATSSYPFDPRQALSVVLIVLFLITGAVIVKVYAEMHRDATLSHVTNTKPGELGAEFWFKIMGIGIAPLLGLLTRVVPGISDFVFSWLGPGISSLK
jgi:hypothetical protein